MSEEITTTKSDISDSMRLFLQSTIIQNAGKYLTCPQCDKKKWIMDWQEDCWKIVDVPRLRYICQDCNIVVVEAKGNG